MAESIAKSGGMAAFFSSPEDVVRAARACRAEGYTVMDVLSPFPIEGLEEIVHPKRNKVAAFALGGGLTGAAVGFGMQYYSSVIDYPLNVAGKPLFSWPAFIPVTFELTVLFAAFSAAISMIALNGLPHLHHAAFSIPGIERVSLDRFLVYIEARDPRFDALQTRRFLEGLGALKVEAMEEEMAP